MHTKCIDHVGIKLIFISCCTFRFYVVYVSLCFKYWGVGTLLSISSFCGSNKNLFSRTGIRKQISSFAHIQKTHGKKTPSSDSPGACKRANMTRDVTISAEKKSKNGKNKNKNNNKNNNYNNNKQVTADLQAATTLMNTFQGLFGLIDRL